MRLLPASLVSLLALFLPSSRAYTQLSDESLRKIPSPGNDIGIHNNDGLLAPILKVRVPGTPAIEDVRRYFLDFFSKSLPNWNIELQNSTQPTALKKDITFVNIVATRDPPWARTGDVGRLALVAHYDSKLTPDGFIGAIDSAAPCAMIMHAAKSIDEALTRKWQAMQASGTAGDLDEEKGIQILLLDGEEAFITWTADDSIYGARSLAQHWDSEVNPAMSTYHTKISEISLFLLLDLLGSSSPTIPSYFQTTHWAYKHMAEIEQRMRNLQLFQSNGKPWLVDIDKTGNWYNMGIEDDHIPFMARGVEVLHMIPSPFPPVWHKIIDDGEHLDMPTVEDWAKLTTAFAAEWMDLEGFLPDSQKEEREVDEGYSSQSEGNKYGRHSIGDVERDELTGIE